jgi:hypothetical protein
MYKLTNSQSDRLSFDRDALNYYRQGLQTLTDTDLGNTSVDALVSATIFNDDGGWIVDDLDEATARCRDAAAQAIVDEIEYRLES